MAGIYIHIPFCKKRCTYCDFYKTTDLSSKELYINKLISEIQREKAFVANEIIDTIYFGGGTPSVLNATEFNSIFTKLFNVFEISSTPEITIEVNPNDIDSTFVDALKSTPINRVSIGIQSFHDSELRFLGRRHDSEQALDAVNLIRSAGITNISIDLIYGIPKSTPESWTHSVNTAVDLGVSHISAYHLIIEKGTALYNMVQKGDVNEIDEDVSLEQFAILKKACSQNGYEHYETSNFAKEHKYSKHNTNYWRQITYLGLGPSAHSYNGKIRRWNISNVSKYIDAITNNTNYQEFEELDVVSQYNDYVLTSLRTMWGAKISYINDNFGADLKNFFMEIALELSQKNLVVIESDTVTISDRGLFLADTIMSDLMKV